MNNKVFYDLFKHLLKIKENNMKITFIIADILILASVIYFSSNGDVVCLGEQNRKKYMKSQQNV